jgi:hypothetical protein
MPDDTVVIATRCNGPERVFHTDTDCHRIPEANRERDKSLLVSWGYTECQFCNGKAHENGEQRTPLRRMLNND